LTATARLTRVTERNSADYYYSVRKEEKLFSFLGRLTDERNYLSSSLSSLLLHRSIRRVDEDDDDDDDVGRLAEDDVIIPDSMSTSMEDGVRHFIKLSSLIFSPRLRLPPPRSSSL